MVKSTDSKSKKSNPFTNFGKMPPIDKEALVAHHKKNIDALTEANKTALEVMKNITKLQSDYMRQTFEDFSGMMKQMMQPKTDKNVHDVWSQHSDKIKTHVHRTAEHGKTIADTVTKTHAKIYEIFHDRINEGASAIHRHYQKKTH